MSSMTERKSNGSVALHTTIRSVHTRSAHTFIRDGMGARALTAAFRIFGLNHYHRAFALEVYSQKYNFYLSFIGDLFAVRVFPVPARNLITLIYTNFFTRSISNHFQHSQSIGLCFFFAFVRVLVRSCVCLFEPLEHLIGVFFFLSIYVWSWACVCELFYSQNLPINSYLLFEVVISSSNDWLSWNLLTLQFLVRD